MSSSDHEKVMTRYISWCVDPPAPVPSDTCGGQSTFCCPPAGTPSPGGTLTPASVPAPPSRSTPHQAEEGGRKGPPESGNRSEKNPSLQHLEAGGFLLPRSSLVTSRRHFVSWQEGEIDSAGPSSFSPSPAPLPQGQCGGSPVSREEDLGSRPGPGHQSPSLQEERKQRSSHLSHFPPFAGRQGLAEDEEGRLRPPGKTSCDNKPQGKTQEGRWMCPTSAGPRRQRGHSAVPEFPADIFRTSCDLEKENTHLVVVDMVLEVLEGVKWTLSSEPHTHTVDAHRHTQDEDSGTREAQHQLKTFSVLSSDSGCQDCEGDASLTPEDSLSDAEWLAQQLVLEFKRRWLPSHEPRRGRQSLRSSLQELPGTGAVAGSSGSLTEEIRLRTRMRGSLSWAPPRFQIIFSIQPTLRRSEVVASQNFLCAGCGTEVEPKYIRRLRYCDYLGRYFCVCCHGGSDAMIPARVLSCWDFNRYSVSDFSKQLLDSVWHQPLFDLSCVGKSLCSRVKELDKFRGLQEQLLGIRKLLSTCRFSGRAMMAFQQLPAHLCEQPPLFSMDDLLRVKKGQLLTPAKAVLHAAVSHVENCELCLARGFICEFCRGGGVIFPFQSDVCWRCPVCKACFHKHCSVEKTCPKCARIQARRTCADVSRKSSPAT